MNDVEASGWTPLAASTVLAALVWFGAIVGYLHARLEMKGNRALLVRSISGTLWLFSSFCLVLLACAWANRMIPQREGRQAADCESIIIIPGFTIEKPKGLDKFGSDKDMDRLEASTYESRLALSELPPSQPMTPPEAVPIGKLHALLPPGGLVLGRKQPGAAGPQLDADTQGNVRLPGIEFHPPPPELSAPALPPVIHANPPAKAQDAPALNSFQFDIPITLTTKPDPAPAIPPAVGDGLMKGGPLQAPHGPVGFAGGSGGRFGDVGKDLQIGSSNLDPPQNAEVQRGFIDRSKGVRLKSIKDFGGTEETERAVELGLEWLKQHQDGDGKWGLDNLHCKHENNFNCELVAAGAPAGKPVHSDLAATGLALMSFLSRG